MSRPHYFIAIPIPTEISERFEQCKLKAEQTYPFRTWVHKEDYHITLAFLGDASSSQLNDVKQAMGQIAEVHYAFSLRLDSVSTFGQPFSPRILWKGVREEPRLHMMQQDVYNACTCIGFSLEKRPFKPHITIARKWQGENKFDIEGINSIFNDIGKNKSFLVDRIVLYRTHLDRIPKYETLSVSLLSR